MCIYRERGGVVRERGIDREVSVHGVQMADLPAAIYDIVHTPGVHSVCTVCT